VGGIKMKREVLFRAWDIEEQEMIYNAERTYDYRCSGFGCRERNFGDVLDDDNYVVMQYVGITDSKGVKIFEGDIVEYFEGEYYNGCYEFQGIIIVDFDIKTFNDLYNSQNLRVIGNIHQNKELISE
jgi:uncharacterized phage protein (TIGR01671 family)